jgi:hypothetical protein
MFCKDLDTMAVRKKRCPPGCTKKRPLCPNKRKKKTVKGRMKELVFEKTSRKPRMKELKFEKKSRKPRMKELKFEKKSRKKRMKELKFERF